MWLIAAIVSAFFAGLTSILAKCGIKKTDSDLATALRTIIVLIFSWIMVFIVGAQGTIGQIDKITLLFLVLSGLATGLSWICYFKALSMGDVNKVVPIDKSSVILTIVLAIIIFGETQNLALKIVSTVILAVGTLLMIEKKKSKNTKNSRAWMIYAVFSAVFASAQAILAKFGFADGIDSNLGTAIRTGVVLILAWAIVFARGKHRGLKDINGRELIFICLSGLATGVTWLCKYYAIQNGEAQTHATIPNISRHWTCVQLVHRKAYSHTLIVSSLVGIIEKMDFISLAPRANSYEFRISSDSCDYTTKKALWHSHGLFSGAPVRT